ncbi:hypothetical protein BBP40_012354 [Aspergillus hancockii]|nr:hypothetical protein BBP40_012354 [Aspergillus hancockii]
MIRGLSVKHQAFLPNRGNSGAPTSSSSAERVEKWAEEVGLKSGIQPSIKEEDEGESERDRKGHFDRPLREVRVVTVALGDESKKPSGIATVDISSTVPDRDSIQKPLGTAPKTGRCPFGHGAPPAANPAPDAETIRDHDRKEEPIHSAEQDLGEKPDAHPGPNTSRASVVFNGPVFFGFSPEQTASFLQQLGSLVNKQ